MSTPDVNEAYRRLLDVYTFPLFETSLAAYMEKYVASLGSTYPYIHLHVATDAPCSKEHAVSLFRKRVPVYFGRPRADMYSQQKWAQLVQSLPAMHAPSDAATVTTRDPAERVSVVADVPVFNAENERLNGSTLRTAHIYGVNFEKRSTQDATLMRNFEGDDAAKTMLVRAIRNMWLGLLQGSLCGLPEGERVHIRTSAIGMGAFSTILDETSRAHLWELYCSVLKDTLRGMGKPAASRITVQLIVRDPKSVDLSKFEDPELGTSTNVGNLFDSQDASTKSVGGVSRVAVKGAVLVLVNAWDSESLIGNGGSRDPTVDGFFVANAKRANSTGGGGGFVNGSYVANVSILFSPESVEFKQYRASELGAVPALGGGTGSVAGTGVVTTGTGAGIGAGTGAGMGAGNGAAIRAAIKAGSGSAQEAGARAIKQAQADALSILPAVAAMQTDVAPRDTLTAPSSSLHNTAVHARARPAVLATPTSAPSALAQPLSTSANDDVLPLLRDQVDSMHRAVEQAGRHTSRGEIKEAQEVLSAAEDMANDVEYSLREIRTSERLTPFLSSAEGVAVTKRYGDARNEYARLEEELDMLGDVTDDEDGGSDDDDVFNVSDYETELSDRMALVMQMMNEAQDHLETGKVDDAKEYVDAVTRELASVQELAEEPSHPSLSRYFDTEKGAALRESTMRKVASARERLAQFEQRLARQLMVGKYVQLNPDKPKPKASCLGRAQYLSYAKVMSVDDQDALVQCFNANGPPHRTRVHLPMANLISYTGRLVHDEDTRHSGMSVHSTAQHSHTRHMALTALSALSECPGCMVGKGSEISELIEYSRR